MVRVTPLMSNVRSRYSLGVGKSLLIADRPNHPCMSSSELSMRIRNRWSEFKGRASVIVPLLVTLGCSTLDPQNVGSGHYLQILQGELVISEVDTSNAGMLNCPNQAYQIMQANPSLVGRVKCSSIPSQDPLPYSFRAHRQLTPSDGYKPASPYLTRTKTAQACASMRQATSKMEKTIIVTDDCTSVTALPAPKQSSERLATPSQSPANLLIADRLRQLEQLRQEKLITEEEFKSRRQAILNQL